MCELDHDLVQSLYAWGNKKKYFCSKCNAKRDAKRRAVITKLPEVLTVQLMRFVYNMQTMMKEKVRTFV